jgi:GWxTD domain-containing protein
VLLLPVVTACGTWKRVGSAEPSSNPQQVARVFDPSAAFRQMGLIADGGPLGVVGGLRVLAGPTPDTTLVLIALSLHNRGFTFRREGNEFIADYRVELTFRVGTEIAQQVTRDQRIRVAGFRETLRTEESVIFQQFVPVHSGQYAVAITVRDRNGPNIARAETTLDVPGLQPPMVSTPIAVYEAQPRASFATAPTLVANPRWAVAYGTDSVRFYLEAYGLPGGTALATEVVDAEGRAVWQDTTRVDSSRAVAGHVVAIPPGALSIGRHELRVRIAGGGQVSAAPFLVAFSDLWAVANFDDMISLLRYFPPADTLRHLASLTPDERAAAWRRFWHSTDPNPMTPENEALDQYFARLQVANQRFRDEGAPGWLTDRGEVFITIGEPDQVSDPQSGIQARGRVITWVYNEYRLQIYFVDDAGFGRFRLDPQSRASYLQVLNRLRRAL